MTEAASGLNLTLGSHAKWPVSPERVHEGVDEANRIVGGDIVVITSGRSGNCERLEPGMCVMPRC